MSIGLLFWIIYVLCLVFGFTTSWPGPGSPRSAFVPLGTNLILMILLFLLGWQCFGFVIQGPR